MSENAVPDSLGEPPNSPTGADPLDWINLQSQDPTIKSILHHVKNKTRPSKQELATSGKDMTIYLHELEKLCLKDGVLYRFVTDDKGIDRQQLVVPLSHRSIVTHGVHDNVAHPSSESTLALARQRFFWPYMATSIQRYCSHCERCIRRKAKTQKAPLESILPSAPLELVCMDYLTVEADRGGVENILVITDHFTKYAIAVPTKDQKATTVARALWENLICHYGYPKYLLSDQGRDFESKVIAKLCDMAGIKKVRTSPYNPKCNGITERLNRTLLDMLGTLRNSQKKDWRKYISPLAHAYNCIVHNTTGYSPYYLMFGRHARLPIDIICGTDPDMRCSKGPQQYVKDLRERLGVAFSLAKENALKSAMANKGYYDRTAHAVSLEPSDRVLVRNVGLTGKHKIADKWKSGVYVVVRQLPNLPVYVVKPEEGQGPTKTYHRNHLLPIGSLPLPSEEISRASPVERPVTRSQAPQRLVEIEEDDDPYIWNEEDCHLSLTDMVGEPVVSRTDYELNPNASVFEPRVIDHQPVQPVNVRNPSDDIVEEVEETSCDPPLLRRSQRTRQPPARYLNDPYGIAYCKAIWV